MAGVDAVDAVAPQVKSKIGIFVLENIGKVDHYPQILNQGRWEVIPHRLL